MDLSNEIHWRRRNNLVKWKKKKIDFYRQKKKKYGARVRVAKTQRTSSIMIEQVNRAGNIATVNKQEKRNNTRVGSLTYMNDSNLKF